MPSDLTSLDADPQFATCRREAGFALIIVLWTLVLITFIIAQFVGASRVETRVAANLLANAVASAAADGAIYQVIFDLLEPDTPKRRPSYIVGPIKIDSCAVIVRLSNEAALINPNLASPALLQSLIRTTGSDAETAQRLATAILEWIGADRVGRARNTTVDEYRGAGLDYAAPREPLESIAELQRVRGMTETVFRALRPHLSLFANAKPELVSADPIVAAAVQATEASTSGNSEDRHRTAMSLLVRMAATAECAGSAQARSAVVVRIEPQSTKFSILSWNVDEQ